MQNSFLMNMRNPFNDLLENELCIVLFQSTSFSNIVKQIPSGTEFHYQKFMILCVEGLKKFHNIWMSEPFQNFDL